MVKIIDDDFLAVMRELPDTWKVDKWERSPHGWQGIISNGELRFQLSSEWQFIEVSRIVRVKKAGWKEEHLPCAAPRHLSSFRSARDVADIILANSAPTSPA